MGIAASAGSGFVLGLLTPLTAACVLPLYPGFLAYLANRFDEDADRTTYALFGLVVVAGVITFMLLLGLLFSTVLHMSLTTVIEVASPIAFGLLALISITLIADLDFSRVIPQVDAPETGNPLVDGFGFGFFFGAIVVPCNPGFLAALFATSLLAQQPVTNVATFLAFGVGVGFPLLVFSVVSMQWSRQVIRTLTAHRTRINRAAGVIMLLVSLYYLTAVFQVFGPGIGKLVSSAVNPVVEPVYRIGRGLVR